MVLIIISSGSAGGVVVGSVAAVIACVVVCLEGVGVNVGTSIKSLIRRWIAHCFSSMVVSLSSMALGRVVFMLAVRVMLMVGEPTCGDIGYSRIIARITLATNGGEE